MLTDAELAELRAAAVHARCYSDRVKWVRLIDGPLAGLRVTVSAHNADVVAWCMNTRRGCVCVHYTPGDRHGEWRF